MISTGDGWVCEAYGPEAAEAGALCSVADPGQRVCADPADCARTVAAERRRPPATSPADEAGDLAEHTTAVLAAYRELTR
jgi:hypothetical protein